MKALSGLQGCWKLSVVKFVALSGQASLTVCFAIATSGNYAWGQVASDNTLGAESSLVTSPIPGTFQIDGGATRRTNLFHSFSQFSVPTDGIAYFNNALNIQNIMARVTGGSVSNIDGLIAANGTANLFLINPYGIIFGPNASLDIGGSFIGSTANSLNFADDTQFSATATQTTPLLTISVPLGLQYGSNAGSIQTQGSTLQVLNGKTLALVSGNVQLDGAFLQAPGGRVELAGVGRPGTIGLEVDTDSLRLSFPQGIARADVSLNDTGIDVVAGGGGSIAIYGQNLTINNSIVRAGIGRNLGFVGAQAGDITLDAIGEVNIGQQSLVTNAVFRGGIGNSGNINIKTASLQLTDGAAIGAFIFGQGNAGKVVVQAENSVLLAGAKTIMDSTVAEGAVGQGGEINIQTSSLFVTDDAQIGAVTFGQGDAGKIFIQAKDSVSLTGRLTGILSNVGEEAVGQGGEINIKTGLLSITDGAALTASTFGQGNAGNITVKADRSILLVNGEINSAVREGAIGQGGKIKIQANESVLLTGTSGIATGVESGALGDGGDISIQTRMLSLTEGSYLFASTLGEGKSGNIQVDASDSVILAGVDPDGFSSGLFTTTEEGAGGQGGDIRVSTGILHVSDGAVLSARTKSPFKGGSINVDANILEVTNGGQLLTTAFSSGDSGNITVNATNNISLAGSDPTFAARLVNLGSDIIDNDGPASGLFARTEGAGDAGNVTINTPQLTVKDRAQVSASTSGGNGGSITVTANRFEASDGGQLRTTTTGSNDAGNITMRGVDSVTLAGAGSGLFANTDLGSIGNGGNIVISSRNGVIRDGARAAVDSQGTGQGGNIQIQVGSLTLNNRASISAETASNSGGNISLQVQDLLLMRHGSRISTTAGTAQAGGDGGNITIDAQFIVAVPKENSDITANAFTGRGGNINITTQGIYGLEFRPKNTPLSDITASSQFGVNGVVTINTPGVDPTQGLAEFSVEPANVEVAQGCQAGREQASVAFFNTGRGGLAPNPYEPLSSSELWEDVPLPKQRAENPAGASSASTSPATPPNKIVEAQGWLYNEKGEVVLVAQIPPTRPQGRCRLR